MLTIALSKGYLMKESFPVLAQAGIKIADVEQASRKLVFFDTTKQFKFLVIRPTDVPVYVEHGAADIGIAGKDIMEENKDSVAELLHLRFGYCRLVTAAPKGVRDIYKPNVRIATKFVNCAERYFASRGVKAEIIKLYGSIELAPQLNLADAVVDLVATGTTLKENGLEIVDTIFHSTARLVANKIQLRVKYPEIIALTKKLQKIVSKIRIK